MRRCERCQFETIDPRARCPSCLRLLCSLCLAWFGKRARACHECMENGPVKALSIQEPYASMIAEGIKTIETRKWHTKYRGDLLLCASKRPAIKLAGYAFAVMTLTLCEPMAPRHRDRACCPVQDRVFAWCLENLRLIEPVPLKGALGLFDPRIDWGKVGYL